MVQSRVQLPHVPHIFNIPHIHTVVVVDTGQKFGSRVKGQSQCVRVVSPWTGRRQAAAETSAISNLSIYQRCCQYPSRGCAVTVPVLHAAAEVHSQTVRSVQRGDVLQVGRAEHSDHTVGTTTEDEVLTD